MKAKAPLFLSLEDIEVFHRQSLREFGGKEGIRDHDGIRAAVMQPEQVYHYTAGCDLYDIAATYAFHIAQAQAFLDGNKRTAILAALVFLRVNGKTAIYETDALYNTMIGFGEKRATRADLAGIFRGVGRRGGDAVSE